MQRLIKKFEAGGVTLDTNAMLKDLMNDKRFYRNDRLTPAGKRRKSAIENIEDNQESGNRFSINDVTRTFTTLNGSEGLGVDESRFALFNKEKQGRKEVSKLVAKYAKSAIQEEIKQSSNNDIIDVDNSIVSDGITNTGDNVIPVKTEKNAPETIRESPIVKKSTVVSKKQPITTSITKETTTSPSAGTKNIYGEDFNLQLEQASKELKLPLSKLIKVLDGEVRLNPNLKYSPFFKDLYIDGKLKSDFGYLKTPIDIEKLKGKVKDTFKYWDKQNLELGKTKTLDYLNKYRTQFEGGAVKIVNVKNAKELKTIKGVFNDKIYDPKTKKMYYYPNNLEITKEGISFTDSGTGLPKTIKFKSGGQLVAKHQSKSGPTFLNNPPSSPTIFGSKLYELGLDPLSLNISKYSQEKNSYPVKPDYTQPTDYSYLTNPSSDYASNTAEKLDMKNDKLDKIYLAPKKLPTQITAGDVKILPPATTNVPENSKNYKFLEDKNLQGVGGKLMENVDLFNVAGNVLQYALTKKLFKPVDKVLAPVMGNQSMAATPNVIDPLALAQEKDKRRIGAVANKPMFGDATTALIQKNLQDKNTSSLNADLASREWENNARQRAMFTEAGNVAKSAAVANKNSLMATLNANKQAKYQADMTAAQSKAQAASNKTAFVNSLLNNALEATSRKWQTNKALKDSLLGIQATKSGSDLLEAKKDYALAQYRNDEAGLKTAREAIDNAKTEQEKWDTLIKKRLGLV